MVDLRKLLARDARRNPDHNTDADSALPSGSGLEAEYETLIVAQCRRYGIADSSITIEVRQIGRAPDGRDVYQGMIRLARWERDSALRLLLGLPILETKIRRVVRGLWLAEVSHFGGLWLHASEGLHATDAMTELRTLMRQLAPPTATASDSGLDDPFIQSQRENDESIPSA